MVTNSVPKWEVKMTRNLNGGYFCSRGIGGILCFLVIF